MYYVSVPVLLSYEADKNGFEVSVCVRLIKTDLKCLFVEVKFYSDFSEKNVPAFEIKCGHV